MNQDKLSIIVPCYNEENTLAECIDRVAEIADDALALEIIIVNDCSTDNSLQIAKSLQKRYGAMVVVLNHHVNMGKGACIRTGMQHATGDLLAIQDADVEYDPQDLKKLTVPLRDGRADAVFGSRYLSGDLRRALRFCSTVRNKFITLLSNLFTNIHLTDVETCYKAFRLESIQDIVIKENRFGVEAEIVAKAVQKNLRIYEMGVSYDARTPEEGKKVKRRDNFRMIYSIFHYNAFRLPMAMQLIIYLFLGGATAFVNLSLFVLLYSLSVHLLIAAGVSFVIAAIVNYFLCIHFLFRHNASWRTPVEVLLYAVLVVVIGILDVSITDFLSLEFAHPVWGKIMACTLLFFLDFLGRKYIIFCEK